MLILESCVGCGNCVPFCPVGAMSVFGIAKIDKKKCTKCNICLEHCPVEAILEEEN